MRIRYPLGRPMARWITAAACVLLGGASAAGGMGLFLAKAQAERLDLAAQAKAAQERLLAAESERQQAIDRANQKIAAAQTEIAKAQSTVKILEEERELLAKAVPLLPNTGKAVKGWTTTLNVPLGISVLAPADMRVESNDVQGLLLASPGTNNGPLDADRRWFSATRYDERQEVELLNQLANSEPVSYAINGRLFLGQRGTYLPQNRAYAVFRVRYKGQNSHLLWIREPATNGKTPILTTVLASISFAD